MASQNPVTDSLSAAPPAANETAPPQSSRWYWLYFALAAFDLLTVSFSLYLNHLLTQTYSESVKINEQWAQRLGAYAALRNKAAEVNAPGNDVFDSQAVEAESTRLRQALSEFQRDLNAAKQELTAEQRDEQSALLLEDFAKIGASMDEMVAEANLIFGYFRNQQPREAGGRMATMDRKYARLNQAFAALEEHVRDIQRRRFQIQHEFAQNIRRAEYAIGGAIALMVLGVSWYGTRVIREMSAATRARESLVTQLEQARGELERRVEERTAALLRTNESLNVQINERRAAEAQVHDSERQLRQLNDDLEERVERRTVELAAANKELEAFAYSVSHDLRSPLRGIEGWSTALVEDYAPQLDQTAHTYLNRVRAETGRMSRLIDDMLELSRVTRAEMRRAEVSLSGIAQEIIAGLRERHPEREVEVNIQPEMSVVGDANLLRQALQNLLENAWKFTGKCARASIQFSAKREEKGVVYRIRDNGAGFDMAYANKLFGAFQRLHKATDYPGTGVGLATVQRVIRRHGGEIWAQSELGQGATFCFTLEGSA